MSAIEDACPFDEPARAARCRACCNASSSVPPCVAAYLGGPVSRYIENVVPIRQAEPVVRRRAA
jgi:hypothetical protein